MAVATAQIFYQKVIQTQFSYIVGQGAAQADLTAAAGLFLASKAIERPISLKSVSEGYF